MNENVGSTVSVGTSRVSEATAVLVIAGVPVTVNTVVVGDRVGIMVAVRGTVVTDGAGEAAGDDDLEESSGGADFSPDGGGGAGGAGGAGGTEVGGWVGTVWPSGALPECAHTSP